MNKSFKLVAIALGLMVGSLALTACGDDDDDDKNSSSNNGVSIQLNGTYKVNADLMGITWVDTVYFNKVNDTLVNMTIPASSMPQEGYRISAAEFKNVTIVRNEKGFELKNCSSAFEASIGMGASAGAPIVQYSTKNDQSLLKVNAFSGFANADTLNVEISLQAGRMPLSIPLTITSISGK